MGERMKSGQPQA